MKHILFVLIASMGCQGGLTISSSPDDPEGAVTAPGSGDEESIAAPDPVTDATQAPLDPDAEPDVGPSTITRISRGEYSAYVTSVLGGVEVRPELLPADHRVGQFTSNALQAVTQADLDAYWQSAEFIAGQLEADDLCDAGGSDAECFSAVAGEVARPLFRRPPSAETLDEIAAFGQQLADDGATRTEVVQVLVATILQSPRFVYHVEPVADVAGMQVLDDHAIAHRLARFLWNGAPDAELLDAADAGELQEATKVEQQARRMLADPRAEVAVQAFHRDWLEVQRLDGVNVDPDVFGDFEDARDDLAAEFDAFSAEAALRGSFTDLLGGDWAMLNGTLADYYGVGQQLSGFERVESVPARRGIMTTGAVLAAHGTASYTQALFRGLFVREQVLCQGVGGRPNDVEEGLSMQQQTLPDSPSDRERLEHLTAPGECASCHVLMNPIGFAFDSYDAVGRVRDVDTSGAGVVTSFRLEGNGAPTYDTDVDGEYADAIDLADALSKSETARTCYTRQWFRFATGRLETNLDAATLYTASRRLGETDDVRELLIALATSEAVRTRAVVADDT